MGTWSRPLFVTVQAGKPEDYIIDLTKLKKETIDIFKHGAFFPDTYDATLKTWSPVLKCTLKEFMLTGCDTHKLLDHMSNSYINAWQELFTHILDENPGLDNAQFHFFCSDTQEPYFFNLDRKEPRDHFYMAIGQSESLYYFKPKNFLSNNDERKLVFREDLYLKNWKKCNYRYIRLSANKSLFF